MALIRVTSVTLRPDRAAAFQQGVAELATAAAKKKIDWHWTAHQTIFGPGLVLHFSSRAESFQEIEAQGQVDDLWLRVLGDAEGAEGMARTNECIQSVQQMISIDRPDLSYAEDVGAPGDYPYAVITVARVRPGHADSCEELIRKVAEAIPKVGDSARLVAYQVMLGDMSAYWTVRPLRSLAELDQQLPAPELLNQAFGPAEGGLLWRSGSEAIQEARREVTRLVPELSNPARG